MQRGKQDMVGTQNPCGVCSHQVPVTTRPSRRENSAVMCAKVEFKGSCPEKMQCVVHDRVWVYHDTVLVEGLDSGCTIGNVKDRVNELTGIPGANMEVVIFFVHNSRERSSTADDSSSAGCSSTGGSRGSETRPKSREQGRISLCLWTPAKSGRDKRFLVTAAANPA